MRWLWIDRIIELEPGHRLVATKSVSMAEEQLRPVRFGDGSIGLIHPASLIIEGAAQSAGILVGHANGFSENVILAKIGSATLSAEATPGTTIRYEASIRQLGAQGAATTIAVSLLDVANPNQGYIPIGSVEIVFSHVDKSMGLGTAAGLPGDNFVFGEGFKTLLRTSGVEIPAKP